MASLVVIAVDDGRSLAITASHKQQSTINNNNDDSLLLLFLVIASSVSTPLMSLSLVANDCRRLLLRGSDSLRRNNQPQSVLRGSDSLRRNSNNATATTNKSSDDNRCYRSAEEA
jgi:hypothetical protein